MMARALGSCDRSALGSDEDGSTLGSGEDGSTLGSDDCAAVAPR